MKATFLILALFIVFQVDMPSYASDPVEEVEEEAWSMIQEKFGENKLHFLQSLRKAFCSNGKLEDQLKDLSKTNPKMTPSKVEEMIIQKEDAGKIRSSRGYRTYAFTDDIGDQVWVYITREKYEGRRYETITFRDSKGIDLFYTKAEGRPSVYWSWVFVSPTAYVPVPRYSEGFDDPCLFNGAGLKLENEVVDIYFNGEINHTIKKEAIRDIPSAETCPLPEEDFYFDQVYAAADNQKDVLLAIIDNGLDLNHPALANRFQNRKEIAKQRLNTPSEHRGHGTMVAGVALKNSRYIRTVPIEEDTVKSDERRGPSYVPDEMIQKASSSGAQVANISWGMEVPNIPITMEMVLRGSENTLFVTSAGNDGQNGDEVPHFPSWFSSQLDNVISVAATDRNRKLADFSNFGHQTVDVAAPGVDVETAIPLCLDETSCPSENDGKQDGFKKASGTSFSAPLVSNVAAKILVINPDLTPPQLKKIIMETV